MTRKVFVTNLVSLLEGNGFTSETEKIWCRREVPPPQRHVININGQYQELQIQNPEIEFRVSLVGNGKVDNLLTVQILFEVFENSSSSKKQVFEHEEIFYQTKEDLSLIDNIIKKLLYGR